MTIDSVTQMRDEGNSLSVGMKSRSTSTKYKVKCSGGSNASRLIEIEAHFLATTSLPYPGRSYSFGGETNALLVCDGLDIKQAGKSNELYFASAKYKQVESQEEDQPSPDTDPEDWSPRMRVRNVTYSEIPETAIYRSGLTGDAATIISAGDEVHISNSAFKRLKDVKPKEITGRAITITRWYSSTTPLAIDQATFPEDVVNSTLVYLTASGMKIKLEALSARLGKFTSEPTTIAGKKCLEITCEIIQKPQGSVNPTWRDVYLDIGTEPLAITGRADGKGGTITGTDVSTTKATHRPLATKFGDPLSEPVLFNGDGEPLTEAQINLGERVLLTYGDDNEIAFLGIDFLDGIASAS